MAEETMPALTDDEKFHKQMDDWAALSYLSVPDKVFFANVILLYHKQFNQDFELITGLVKDSEQKTEILQKFLETTTILKERLDKLEAKHEKLSTEFYQLEALSREKDEPEKG